MKLKSLTIIILILFPYLVFASQLDSSNLYKDKLKIYSNNRAEYISLYNNYKSLCGKNTDKTCEEKKAKVLEKIKSHLNSAIETVLFYADFLKLEVQESKIVDTEKNKIIDEFEIIVDTANNFKSQIDNLKSAEDVKKISTSLKNFYVEKEVFFLKIRGKIVLSSLEQSNKNINNLSTRIENYLTNLSNNYNVDEDIVKYNETKKKILDLNDNLLALKSDVDKIKNKDDFKKIKQRFIDYKNLTAQIIQDFKLILNNLKKEEYRNNTKSDLGEFYIKGKIEITLTGNFEITGNVLDSVGDIEVVSYTSDNVDTFGEGIAKRDKDKTIFSKAKKIKINSNKELSIFSGNAELGIKGNGKIVFSGDGLYKKGDSGTWKDVSYEKIEENI